MIKVLVFSLYGSTAASHRYRFLQYQKKLKIFGIKFEINSLMTNEYLKYRFFGGVFPFFSLLFSFLKRIKELILIKKNNYDLAIIYCELFPCIPFFIEKLLLPTNYIYDFDDSFHIKYKNNIFLKKKIDKLIKLASVVTAGNNHLTNYAKKINLQTVHLPTAVDTNVYSLKKKIKKKNSSFVIGWIGSPSTQVYLSEVIHPISKLAKELDITFSIIGAKAPNILNVKIKEIPWKKNTYLQEISKFDVGIMPLKDDEWTRGKCAFKLIQYMAIGVPVIASNVGANKDLLNYSRGFLARNSSEWIRSFREIYKNKRKIKKMISNSKSFIRNNYSSEINIKKLSKIIKVTVS